MQESKKSEREWAHHTHKQKWKREWGKVVFKSFFLTVSHSIQFQERLYCVYMAVCVSTGYKDEGMGISFSSKNKSVSTFFVRGKLQDGWLHKKNNIIYVACLCSDKSK